MAQPTRWILCTKWQLQIPKPLPADAPEGTPQELQVDESYWTPIGTHHIFKRRAKIAGIPTSYATEADAVAGLRDIVNREPAIASQHLNFVAVEVRYVPNKIKAYKQDWYNKYALCEQPLDFSEHKFTDTMK